MEGLEVIISVKMFPLSVTLGGLGQQMACL